MVALRRAQPRVPFGGQCPGGVVAVVGDRHGVEDARAVGVDEANLQDSVPDVVAGPAGTFRRRTEISPAQEAILEQLGIGLPPKIYQLTPIPTG